jgi:hypothetical protein
MMTLVTTPPEIVATAVAAIPEAGGSTNTWGALV